MTLRDCPGYGLSTAGGFLREGAPTHPLRSMWGTLCLAESAIDRSPKAAQPTTRTEPRPHGAVGPPPTPPDERGWLSEYPARAGFGARKADRATFFRILPVAAAALLLPLVLAACGSSTEYSVTMTEFAFEPGKFGLKRGEKAIITLQNKGSVEHNFVIPQLNFSSPTVAPGQTAKIELSIPRGPLKVVCTIPGHEEAGMVGEITLEARR